MIKDDFFTILEEQLDKKFPFVAYRKPMEEGKREETKALLQQDAITHRVKDFSESGFIFAPFEEQKKALIIPSEASKEISTEYIFEEDHKNVKKEEPPFPPNQLRKLERVEHESLVQKAVDTIKKGKLLKVVISRTESVQTQLKVIEIFKNILKRYNSAFVYLWFHPETGIWMGATPETLVSVERNRFKTMALAGTQSFHQSVDVEWEAKDKEEQQIVTDYIIDRLQKSDFISAEKLRVSEAYTAKAGNLLHLRTDIEGNLKAGVSGLKELIGILHPTPAVCGLPKDNARNFILENEGYDRKFYSGFLGELNLKKETKRNSNRRNQENQAYASISRSTSLFVNLRCMKIKEGMAELFIGGGVTKDSNPSLEWEETVNKAHTMKSILVK
ncbi:chorismate-binding protein [Autumnicola edwardsiae]|uniref:Chorismate-binding protein n=1 Tax=Autumnicola edwardsiae TaxID=3075594 RepID=A0ABU3CTH1_9FLAO|nr:chorismate-binding protein [Zunongwangia sp. F297]MDT0649571.1 chorismate-binding protein [Zunongwangia sp. F297]